MRQYRLIIFGVTYDSASRFCRGVRALLVDKDKLQVGANRLDRLMITCWQVDNDGYHLL